MTKINIILISSLLTIAFSFSQVDGYDVIQDKIVVKINDNFAPKLGSENPLTIKDLIELFFANSRSLMVDSKFELKSYKGSLKLISAEL